MAKKVVKALRIPESTGNSARSRERENEPSSNLRLHLLYDLALIVVGVLVSTYGVIGIVKWWQAETDPFRILTGLELMLGVVVAFAGLYSLNQHITGNKVKSA